MATSGGDTRLKPCTCCATEVGGLLDAVSLILMAILARESMENKLQLAQERGYFPRDVNMYSLHAELEIIDRRLEDYRRKIHELAK